jgi:hypothetical protein
MRSSGDEGRQIQRAENFRKYGRKRCIKNTVTLSGSDI